MGSFQLEDFAAGWIGGAASVIVGYPLDTVKTRLQAGVGYGNTLSCIRMVYRKESVFGFFKGMSFPLASIAVYNSVVFGVFSNTQRILSQLHSREPEASPPRTLSDLLLASMVAGVVSVGLGTPVDLIKIRLQMQTQAFRERAISWGTATPMDVVKSRLQADGVYLNKYKGVLDCISQSYQKDGLKRHHGECCAGLPHERSHVPGVRALAAGHQRELPGDQPLSARARAGVMDQGPTHSLQGEASPEPAHLRTPSFGSQALCSSPPSWTIDKPPPIFYLQWHRVKSGAK
ncbi:solute carrier family 25 member 48 isoform X4 [Myotis yumanensis]|uniref:solute carrier family 25 member 48 isoform X4 n=1 Tax=Myotis yumanensis TaxID=159337 RepID=UPI0038D2518C